MAKTTKRKIPLRASRGLKWENKKKGLFMGTELACVLSFAVTNKKEKRREKEGSLR